MKKIVKVQKSKQLYICIPTEIAKQLEIKKGENVLISLIQNKLLIERV